MPQEITNSTAISKALIKSGYNWHQQGFTMIFNYRIAIDINLNFALVLKEQKANNWKEVNQNERKYG